MEEWIREHAEIWELVQTYGIKVIGALVAAFFAWIIAGKVSNVTRKRLEARNFDVSLTRFFAQLIRWAILIAAAISILGVFGVETSSFAAIIGAGGLAVGLAFQGTLSNFSAGVMLLVFRPFKVGDVITVSGVTGAVAEIGLFTVELVPPDNTKYIIPNSAVFGAQIHNLTYEEKRRVDVTIGCDYSADIDETRKVLEGVCDKVIKEVDGALSDPAPQVFLTELGGSSVDWQLRVWTENANYFDVAQELRRSGKYALDEAGIGIPFPQMDVHIDRIDAAAE